MANINVEPAQGIVGQTINIDGIGFLPSSSVTILFGSVSIPAVTTDTSGNFNTSFAVPSSYGNVTISASDGTNSGIITFIVSSEDSLPEYCTADDMADWLRIDITATSNPNRNQVNNIILQNQARIDYTTGHSWLKNGQIYIQDQAHVPIGIWDYSRGMPIYLKHRFVRPLDSTKGDMVEIWNGNVWQQNLFPIDNSSFDYTDAQRGILYIKGFQFSILTQNRFRVTYHYGGNNEGLDPCPKDIKRACIYLSAIDLLSTDFSFSQIKYGGEGNVNKKDVMDRWQIQADRIMKDHSEILSVWG